jgi:FecR protein
MEGPLMNTSKIKTIFLCFLGFCFLATLVSAPAWSQNPPPASPPKPPYPNLQNPSPNQNARPPQIGAINYVEGQAAIGNQELSDQSVGSAVLLQGQELTTSSNGRVEILLTPGIFLRVDHGTTVTMVNPGLADTTVALLKGRALVEVTDISKNNNVRITLADTPVQLLKTGLYDFDANQNVVRVFKGKANVFTQGHTISLGGDHEVTLAADTKAKSKGFDNKQYTDDFFRWSGLRAGYLAEADADTASLYVNGGPGWVGAGWYWDPWFSAYTFIPGDGIFYSPFGWGFYSPWAVYGSPFFYGGYGWGHYHRFGDFHPPYGHGFEPQGGFHGAVGGFHGGGGFGGGGFHGGGGGGGHH